MGRKWEGDVIAGPAAPGGEPQTYRMYFLTTGGLRNFPVEGCWGQSETQTAMWVNFLHRHVHDNMIILEEGKLPQPQCPRYNMLVS